MSFTNVSSTHRTTYSNSSRGTNLAAPTSTSVPQRPIYSNDQPSYSNAQNHYLNEEQPYYSHEQSIPVPISTGNGDQRRGVQYLVKVNVSYGHADGDHHRSVMNQPRISTGQSSYQYASQSTGQDQFTCSHCDRNLSGSRYIMKDDRPYCINCYEERFANTCEECRRKIGTDSKDLSYKDRHWHERCFFCSMCKTPLVDKPFGCKNDQLFCGECYNQQFASRCDKCNQIFKPGTKKLEYRGQQFHEHCFTCSSCTQPIGTKSFIPKDQKNYCVPCYEEHFATKCTRCLKVIAQGGVTYRNQPWHRECFTCTNCKNSLAGQRFTSRDDHPYCADCFARLFAKKCFACNKPITGVGGTRYISFEDRHWHNECFMCRDCGSSLVGRGFLTEGPNVLCPDCGKRDHHRHHEQPSTYLTSQHRAVVSDYHRID